MYIHLIQYKQKRQKWRFDFNHRKPIRGSRFDWASYINRNEYRKYMFIINMLHIICWMTESMTFIPLKTRSIQILLTMKETQVWFMLHSLVSMSVYWFCWKISGLDWKHSFFDSKSDYKWAHEKDNQSRCGQRAWIFSIDESSSSRTYQLRFNIAWVWRQWCY